MNLMSRSRNEYWLTDRQEKFCWEYVKDFNASRAARDAGYSEKSASVVWTLLKNKPKVKERLALIKEELFNEAKIDAQWIIKNAVDIVEKCTQQQMISTTKEVKVTEVNEETGEEEELTRFEIIEKLWKFDPWGANTALSLLTKVYALDTMNINTDSEMLSEVLNDIRKGGSK